jgi:hypothetical protein
VPGVEFFVDLEPESDRDPARQCEGEYQRFALHGHVEFVVQMQQGARLVCGLKRDGGQDNVGQTEQNTGFTVPAEHPASAYHYIRVSGSTSMTKAVAPHL